MLRIGGRLLLTTPNPNYIRRKLQRSSVFCSYHQTQHYPRVLRQRLRMHGFSRVRLYGSGQVSQLIGSRVPALALYGSYLITADKY